MAVQLTGSVYQNGLAEVILPGVKPTENSAGRFKLYDDRVHKIINYQGVYEHGYITGLIDVRYEIFLSDDGGKLLELVRQNQQNVIKVPGLVQIFIETNNDTFSKRVIRTLCGPLSYKKEDIKLDEVIRPYYDRVSNDDLNVILGSIFSDPKSVPAVLWEFFTKNLMVIPEKVLSVSLGLCIKGIDLLRVEDSWWMDSKDPEHKSAGDESLKKFLEWMDKFSDTAVSTIAGLTDELTKKYLKSWKGKLAVQLKEIGKSLGKILDAIRQFKNWVKDLLKNLGSLVKATVAFVCGIWNGIVDMISGLLFVVKAIVDGVKALKEGVVSGIDSSDMLLEEMDALYDSLGNVSWSEVFGRISTHLKSLPSLMELVKAAVAKAKESKDKAVKAIGAITMAEWAYYIGYGLTFFIPVGAIANVLGKAGKAGQAMGKIFLWIDRMMEKVFKIVLKAGQPLFNKVLALLRKITEKIRSGTAEVKKLIDILFIELQAWLESFAGKAGQLSEVVIDNAVVMVKRITEVVGDKITQLYLVTYKKKGVTLSCTIVPVVPFINLVKDILIFNVRKNIRQLAEEGFELLEHKGTYSLKFENEIFELGSRTEAAKKLNKILKASTTKEAKRDLVAFLEIQAKFVGIGNKSFKDLFKKELDAIKVLTNTAEFLKEAEARFAKKPRKIPLQEYIRKHTQRVQNVTKGGKAEELYKKMFGGDKAVKSIKTAYTNRFIDNIKDNIGREIKSGLVKNGKGFQKQFSKDIDIIRRTRAGIDTYEWHCMDGIDEDALLWAFDFAKRNGVEHKIKFIMY